jgi:hypothetical protein
MRARFLVGILAIDTGQPEPIGLADFVVEWTPSIVVAIRHCPFCGVLLDRTQPTRRIVTRPATQDDGA